MEYGAIDLHKQHSVIRIVDEDGGVVLERKVVTTREAVTRVFAPRGPMRVLVESGTESEWVAQTVEACGHTVIVADPNYTLMYGARARAVKTDRRDVATLAEACRREIYRRAHRVSADQRARRREVRVREQLVRIRTQLINLLRAQLRQEGYRLPSGSAETVPRRYARLPLPAAVTASVAPLLDLLEALAPVLTAADEAVTAAAARDPVVQRLMTAPGIGPVTAVTFRAVLDDVTRFADAKAATAFLGLVPREASSGTRQRKGAITKAGPRSLRALLVSAAWTVWRQRRQGGALHAWVERLAARRGRRIAVVGLARRLARMLYAMWRDGCDYRAVPSAVPATA
jgi:transposase